MTFIIDIFSEKLVVAMGWTLFHSLWQGAIVVLIFAGLMLGLRKTSARTKYLVGVMALGFMLMISLLTFVNHYNRLEGSSVSLTAGKPGAEAAGTHAISGKNISATAATSEDKTALASTKNRVLAFFSDYFERHLPLIVTLWLGGMLVLMLKFIGGFLYHQRFKQQQVRNPSPQWIAMLTDLKKKLDFDKGIEFLASGLAKVPMTIGYFKPVILMPVSILAGMPVAQVEALLAHELAHIVRRDYLVNIFQALLDILYFYHPGIRWISSMVRFERENSCDDMAVQLSGDSKTYAEALTGIQQMQFSSVSVALAAAGRKNQLLNRIRRIIHRPGGISGFSEGFLAASILGVGIMLLGFSGSLFSKKRQFNSYIPTQNINELSTESERKRVSEKKRSKLNAERISYSGHGKTVQDKNKVFKAGFRLLKKTNLLVDAVISKNQKLYKKMKLKKTDNGKTVWHVRKRKLENWGPLHRLKDTLTLEPGGYEIYIKPGDSSFSLIFKDKRSGEVFGSPIYKSGFDSMTDKMVGLFAEEQLGKSQQDKAVETYSGQVYADQRIIEREQKAYRKQALKVREKEKNRQLAFRKEKELKMAKELAARKQFEKALKETREHNRRSEKKALEQYERELKKAKERRKIEEKLIETERRLAIDLKRRKEKEEKALIEAEERMREQEVTVVEEASEKELAELEEEEKEIETKIGIREKELAEQEKEVKHEKAQLKRFKAKLRQELVKDGLLKLGEKLTFQLHLKDGMRVNGKKCKEKYVQKYLRMYQKYFMEKLGDARRLIIDDEY